MDNRAKDKGAFEGKLSAKSYLLADWPAPENVRALVTSRKNGVSQGVYNSFNLAFHVDDNAASVQKNRSRLQLDLNLKNSPFWLEQTHGNTCVKWCSTSDKILADASYSSCPDQACVVMTADCLPILFCNQQGDWVAACHAGWRGLAGGVVENTINQYKGASSDLLAWIGPAISKEYFEVGEEVMLLFVNKNREYKQCFSINSRARYQFDFVLLVQLILRNYQVKTFGGDRCSYAEQAYFYSYRRDGQTGRMASLIWFE